MINNDERIMSCCQHKIAQHFTENSFVLIFMHTLHINIVGKYYYNINLSISILVNRARFFWLSHTKFRKCQK